MDLKDSDVVDLSVALGKAHAGQGHVNEAVASFTEALDLAVNRAGKTKIIAEAAPLQGVLQPLVPHLAQASAANPRDTALSLDVAALQAWFGQEQEYAATRRRILASARGVNQAGAANEAARACSILPSADPAELDAALALARTAVRVGNGGAWNLLALGMAEYRSGHDAAAEEALLAADKAAPNNRIVNGISAFYRAMSLFRQGKRDDARGLALGAAATMTPLPRDTSSPLPGNFTHHDLILWLAYKEAKALIQFDAAPPAKVGNDKK
jgi:tetratricopeptide (TPR) repeat protein